MQAIPPPQVLALDRASSDLQRSTVNVQKFGCVGHPLLRGLAIQVRVRLLGSPEYARPHGPLIGGISLTYLSFAQAIWQRRNLFLRENLPGQGLAAVVGRDLLDGWLSILALRSLGLDTIVVDTVDVLMSLGILDAAVIVMTKETAGTSKRPTNAFGSTKWITVPSFLSESLGEAELPQPCGLELPCGDHQLYTSGTTGTRKRVMLPARNEAPRNADWARSFGFDDRSVFHALQYQLFTAVGFLKPAAVWSVGGMVVIGQGPDPFASLMSPDVTCSVIVPSILEGLVTQAQASQVRKANFQLLVAGGVLSAELAKRTKDHLCGNVGAFYASTEIAAITLRSPYETADDLIWFQPTGLRDLEIVDGNGRECAIGVEGELRIRRRDFDAQGYVDNPEASAKIFRDGCFYPGDMAVRRLDGRIRILGRTADVLIIKGQKIATAPIEHNIRTYLTASEVCVFSGIDKSGSEIVVVAVQSSRPIPQAQAQGISGFFARGTRIRVVSMPAFPRTTSAMAKTDRAALKKMLFES
eukprot:gene19334-19737_t